MDELTDNFNGPNRLRIVTQVKREIRKNKRVGNIPYVHFPVSAASLPL